jgi:adenine C2-methylase RlmN of 23S rRNA A2503 and tRNA A37
MGKAPRVHFLTAYFEYLLDQGIKTENDYLGDASRFLRFLLARATPDDIDLFISNRASGVHYQRRLKGRLRKFYKFAQEELGITHNPCG